MGKYNRDSKRAAIFRRNGTNAEFLVHSKSVLNSEKRGLFNLFLSTVTLMSFPS